MPNLNKLITLMLFLSQTVLHSQTPVPRSERYVEVYKKYLSATCPVMRDSIQHFVYFARNRELIIEHPFLSHPMFKGAQIMYSWRDFETVKGKYDFSTLKADYEYLKIHNKKIFSKFRM
jgi:hypothetical protein